MNLNFLSINIIILIIFECIFSYKIKITGANFLIRKFNYYNIDTVFGYTGGCNLKLFDELFKSNIKVISNRNEQCCGHSAEAYSKITKKIGILITTSGPGLTNVITPLQDAFSDGIPLLLISGQVHANKLGTSAFQECNATDITKSCVKKNILITNIKMLIENFDKMIFEALENRKGPVHLDICTNVFNEEIEIENICYKNIFNKKILPNVNKIRLDNKKFNQIKDICNLLEKATKPVLIVGQGCKEDYLLLRKFVKKFNIPVCSTLHGLGIIDNEDKNFLGMLGMHGTYQANMAVHYADLIIGLGNRFDDRTIGTIESFGKNAKNIVHIDNSINKINEVNNLIKPDISLHLDSEKFLKTILNFNSDKNIKKKKKFTKKINLWKNKFTFEITNELTIPLIVSKLSKKFNENNINPIISTGVGVHQMQLAQYYKFKYPNKLLTSGSQGTMGVGLPFAIGAKLAEPDSFVLCIDGDGSFQMTSSDLMTIINYNLPIKIIIMDNQELQMVTYWQEKFYNSHFSSSKFINPDFVKFANSFGIDALICDDINLLDNVIDKMINYPGPMLVHMIVKKTDCLPFVPPLKGLNEMILN